jgi:hypothetical protein
VNEKGIIRSITWLSILVFTGVIVGWHLHNPHQDFEIQAPGADNRPEGLARKTDDNGTASVEMLQPTLLKLRKS